MSNGRSQVLGVLSADQDWVSNGRSQVLGVLSADQEWVSNGRSQAVSYTHLTLPTSVYV